MPQQADTGDDTAYRMAIENLAEANQTFFSALAKKCWYEAMSRSLREGVIRSNEFYHSYADTPNFSGANGKTYLDPNRMELMRTVESGISGEPKNDERLLQAISKILEEELAEYKAELFLGHIVKSRYEEDRVIAIEVRPRHFKGF